MPGTTIRLAIIASLTAAAFATPALAQSEYGPRESFTSNQGSGRMQATLGEKVASGQLSTAALTQLISGSGVTLEEAMNLTLDDIVAIKWQDD